MRRRNCFLFVIPFFYTPFLRSAWGKNAQLSEKYFGRDWRLPRNTTFEIWPISIGLSLSEVMSAVADWTIPSTSRLLIRLPDGEYLLSTPVVPKSINGERLAIIGNQANPEKCRLLWEGGEDMFYLSSGYSLGWIDGLTVEHSKPIFRGLGSAFLADASGLIRCGRSVRVRNFYYGFQARYGGVILCNQTISSNAGDANYFAFNGGHIQAEGARAEFAEDQQKRLGGGFVAEYGGTINASGSVARYNAFAGYVALSNGVIRAYNSLAESNRRIGYYSNAGGIIVAHQGKAFANCETSFRIGRSGGRVEGNIVNQKKPDSDMRYCKK